MGSIPEFHGLAREKSSPGTIDFPHFQIMGLSGIPIFPYFNQSVDEIDTAQGL